MKIDKKVTVLMSEYNTKENELRSSIESILNQTYKNFELLIIDDCSDKKSTDIIKSYKDNRIKLIHNEKNLGLAKSLNKGIDLIDTDYIIRMDTDDIAKKDRIEKQIKFAYEHPEYSIIAGNANYFNENGIFKTTKILGEKHKEDFIKGTPFIHPTMLIKTKDIKAIGGYPNCRRGQDYAMAMEMYANGYKGYVMEDILIDYRMNTAGYKKKKFKYRLLEFKIRWHYFNKLKIKKHYYIYCFKPILVGLIPKSMLEKYHNKIGKE